MNDRPKGTLIIIGGHEDKDNDRTILKYVVGMMQPDKDRLLIVTVASQLPEELAAEYTEVFSRLGAKHTDVLDIRTRNDAQAAANVEKMANAAVVFFTGGDQLRITSQIGDSPVFRCMQERYVRGATIVGTSAGAAAMPETMVVNGESDKSHMVSALSMAPGLALINDVVIDSHFAERGRIGRLLGAVAQNPRTLGIGIDENTAIVVNRDRTIHVLGSGAVYVLDGKTISYSSLSEETPEGIVSIDDVTLHVLGEGDRYDLEKRRPIRPELEKERGS